MISEPRLPLILFHCALLAPAIGWAQPPSTVKPADTPPSYELADDADLSQVIAFVEAIRNYRPAEPEQYTAHGRKMRAVLPGALDRLIHLAEAAEKTDLEVYLHAKRDRLLEAVSRGEQAEVIAGMKSVAAFLQLRTQPDEQDARLALRASYYFANKGAATKEGQALLETLAQRVENVGSEEDNTSERIRGLARRAVLIGNTLELTGVKLDGSKFDLASLRGKVVLVDIWATWHGPALQELPNIKANYEKYHVRGFEVVGVSLDRNREQLEAHLQKHPVPWITLNDEGGKTTVSDRYGVIRPCVFLIDTDGKVVTTQARGEQLGLELEKLLPTKTVAADSNEGESR